jgi:hypothetical protein
VGEAVISIGDEVSKGKSSGSVMAGIGGVGDVSVEVCGTDEELSSLTVVVVVDGILTINVGVGMEVGLETTSGFGVDAGSVGNTTSLLLTSRP